MVALLGKIGITSTESRSAMNLTLILNSRALMLILSDDLPIYFSGFWQAQLKQPRLVVFRKPALADYPDKA